MTPEQEHNLVSRICAGNTEAEDWMQSMRLFVHLIDDIIDEDLDPQHKQRGAERLCQMGALALHLYTHDFFRKNQGALHGAMLNATMDYANSVAWEDLEGWRGEASDWLRHGSIRVVALIAAICGGYRHARPFSEELWTLAYALHHDKEGRPT